jgi:hypothetical protein
MPSQKLIDFYRRGPVKIHIRRPGYIPPANIVRTSFIQKPSFIPKRITQVIRLTPATKRKVMLAFPDVLWG